MNRPRDRISAHGLLPRMETRLRKDGLVTYRYHPLGGKPMNLGTDRAAAIRQVLDLLGEHDDAGSLQRLWAQYQQSPSWADLTPRTRADYTDHAGPLLRVFGTMRAADVTAPMVARYLRVERASAPVRANREIALLGNLISLAIEHGEAEHNPCRGGQVKRNKERPRTNAPAEADLAALATFAAAKGGQWRIIVLAARFAALAGSRQAELLPLHWPQWNETEVRLRRAKQRGGAEKVERVDASPALQTLRDDLQALATNPTMGAVFPNRQGNPYTAQGFACMWGKLMREAIAKSIVARRFTFHDLRAYYVTEHKRTTGNLPDTHASPTTTARVYERSREARRKAL
jgi:integrase